MALSLGAASVEEAANELGSLVKAKPPATFREALALLRTAFDLRHAKLFVDDYADTPILARCLYFQDVLAAFHCPLTSVRLLKLAARSSIREHKDYKLGFEDGEMRIHVPVVTNPDVAFFLAGEQVVMPEGEAWYLDLNLPHRVENHSDIDRIHLVIDCVVNDWARELFPPEMAQAPLRPQI